MWSGSYIRLHIWRKFSICSISEYINYFSELCCHICIKNYLPWTENFSCRKQTGVSDIMTLARPRTPQQTFIHVVPRLLLSVSAQRCGVARVCLSAAEANREPSVRQPCPVWWHVWRWGGVQEGANSHTDLGVSQVVPQGSFNDFSGAHSEGAAQWARAQEKPEPAAEVKEGLSLRLGQKRVFLKEATVRVCAGLWWPHLLTDCSLINIYS